MQPVLERPDCFKFMAIANDANLHLHVSKARCVQGHDLIFEMGDRSRKRLIHRLELGDTCRRFCGLFIGLILVRNPQAFTSRAMVLEKGTITRTRA